MPVGWKSVTAELLLRRLHERIAKEPETGCWLWIGQRSKSGYATFWIFKKNFRVHRLMAWMYLGYDDDGKHEVCHRCNIKLCVNPTHLYIATHAQNMRDAAHDGLIPKRKGEKAAHAILTELQVKDAMAAVRGGMTHRAVAAIYAVDRTTITAIMRGKNWKHLNPEEMH